LNGCGEQRQQTEQGVLVPMVEGHAPQRHARFAAVDLAKLAAAAAVVWIHVINCDESRALLPLCRFAVPFFTCAAVYFVLQKIESGQIPFATYCLQRARRLYVPFMLWSAVYLAARVIKHKVLGFGSPIVFSGAVLLNGTAHHLWFLPFICLVSVVAYGLARVFPLPRPERRKRWAAGFLVAGLALAFIPCPVPFRSPGFPVSYFIDHAWEAIPAAFFGITLFLLLSVQQPGHGIRWGVLAVGMTLMLSEFIIQGEPVSANVTGACLLFFTVTQQNRRWMHAVWPWAQLAFAIYLVHVLFVEALQSVAIRFGTIRSLSTDLSVWALSLLVSAIAAKAFLRSNYLSWAVPR
jgi:surface polysaccharide O-acyltransferase-like enzyme